MADYKRSRSASGSLSPRTVPGLETSPSVAVEGTLETRINVRPDVPLHEPLARREAPRPHSHNGTITSSPRGFPGAMLMGGSASASSSTLNTRPPSPGALAPRRGSLLGITTLPAHQSTHLPSISSMLPPIDIRRPRSANLSRGGSPSGSISGMRPYSESSSRPGLSYYTSGSGSSGTGSGPLQPEFHRQRSMTDFPTFGTTDESSFAAYSAPYRASVTSSSGFGQEDSGVNTPAIGSPIPTLPPPGPAKISNTSYHARSYEYDERDSKRPRLPEPQSYSSGSPSIGPFGLPAESSSSSSLPVLRRSSSLRSPPSLEEYSLEDGRDDGRDESGRSGRVLKRTYQACIRCRTKKLKCDSRLPRCTPCANAGTECQQADVRRQTSYPRGYVENLEEMCQVQERLLRRLLPNVPPSEYKALAADESRWGSGSDRPINRQ